jgi:hypothetical protein
MAIIFLVGDNLRDVSIQLHSYIVCSWDCAPSWVIFLGEIWGAYGVNIALIHHLFWLVIVLHFYL